MNTLWVGLGGAVGSIARYHVGRAVPAGTIIVNLAGCFAIGLLMALVARERVSEVTRVAVGVGMLGGFTTYSTFNHETVALVQAGAYGRAAVNIGVTLVGGIVLGLAGWAIGRAA